MTNQPTPDLEAKTIKCPACDGKHPTVVKCKVCEQTGQIKIPKMTGRDIDRMNKLLDISVGKTDEQRKATIRLTGLYEQHNPPTKHFWRH